MAVINSSEILKNVNREALEPEDNLNEAKEEYIKDIANYKKEANTKISTNEQID